MKPATWEELFKTEFFAVTPQVTKKARYAAAIADLALGEHWWRHVNLNFGFYVVSQQHFVYVKFFFCLNSAFLDIDLGYPSKMGH